MSSANVLVCGGGVFGLTAALELRSRGCSVTLVDPGPLPHPLAASTDVSKVVRLEYGADAFYMALMESAREGWLEWNARAVAGGREPVYHETGVLMLSRRPMAPGGFEHDSFRLLVERGHAPERLDAGAIAARFPAWRASGFTDGFFHAKGGYAESGRVVAMLADWADASGVTLRIGARLAALRTSGGGEGGPSPSGRVGGARLSTPSGDEDVCADVVVIATGAWVASLLPELGHAIRPSGHPVFHLAPRDPGPFRPEVFPVFTADVARTGYYGFPVGREGIVKIGNHGRGVSVDADAPREIPRSEHERLRAFLAATFPDLVDAEVVCTRLCLYADTQDEDLWIAANPDRPGLVVAGGGSGHGFKFAPVLGSLVADAALGVASPRLARFGWRPELRLDRGTEAARCHDE